MRGEGRRRKKTKESEIRMELCTTKQTRGKRTRRGKVK